MSKNVLAPIVNAYFDTLAKGDTAAFSALLDDNIVWHQPGSNQFLGDHKGKEALLNMLGGQMAYMRGSLKVVLDGEIMYNGNLAACPVRFSGSNGTIDVDLKGVDLLEIQNGKITRAWLFSAGGGKEDEFWGADQFF